MAQLEIHTIPDGFYRLNSPRLPMTVINVFDFDEDAMEDLTAQWVSLAAGRSRRTV